MTIAMLLSNTVDAALLRKGLPILLSRFHKQSSTSVSSAEVL
jgi:hypothetical protein